MASGGDGEHVSVLGWRELAEKLRRAPRDVTAKVMVPAMTSIGIGLQRHVMVNKLSGNPLKARTGNLRRAIFHRVEFEGDDVVVLIGVDGRKAKYGRIQELGGTIRPKRARHLAIPIGEALTGNGVARFTARELISSPGSFGYLGTFVRNKVIFGKRDGGQFAPLFALKSSVTIKAVGYLSGTVEEKRGWAKDQVAKALRAWVQETRG